LIKKLIYKFQNKELKKYIFWKLGIDKIIRMYLISYRYIYDQFFKIALSLFKNNSKVYVNLKFFYLKHKKSDIYKHLQTLYIYSKECESIFETGVRGVVSSWAFLKGLIDNGSKEKYFFLNDINVCDTAEIEFHSSNLLVDINYIWKNNLEIEINKMYDLTFIDTWHVYAQLKRELEKFSKHTNKYIIMHDTTVDGELGETIRRKWNSIAQSKESGFPVEEIEIGLWPAILEFLDNNNNWELEKRYENCNGLTILKRINQYE
tara:strand:- start:2636 stop:3421 length:786 start_codon:yes stop_codon:yes gene_type:complete